MSRPQTRAAFIDDLLRLYGSGIKERENSSALYDLYLENMRAGVRLHVLVEETLSARAVVRILDIGCGDAGALRALVAAYPGRVDAVGMDLVPPDAADSGVRVYAGDALRLPLPSQCDLIFSFRALHEIGGLDAMIPKIARALAAGGRAFLSIRIAEEEEGRIVPQGLITPRDVQWLRGVLAMRRIAGVRAEGAEVAGVASLRLPGAPDDATDVPYVRGVNLFLTRV
jgi:SAM-dependent methyltransferase